jgi:hypothetical protein
MTDAPPRAAGPLGPEEQPVSRLAIASLVLGVLGFLTAGITGIIGIVCGIMAVTRTRGGEMAGTAMAVIGLITSSLSVVVACVTIGLVIPTLSMAQQSANAVREMMHLRQLGQALHAYAAENDDTLPTAGRWDAMLVGVDPEVAEWLLAPGAGPELVEVEPEAAEWLLAPGAGPERAFAFNAKLDGVSLDAITDKSRTVLLFECAPGSPAAGGPELFPSVPRHDAFKVQFVDGNIESVLPSELDELVWDP